MTKKIDGRTVSVHLKAGPELDKVSGEVANYKRFKEIVGRIVEVSETICDARPASPFVNAAVEPEDPRAAEKRDSVRSSQRRSPPR